MQLKNFPTWQISSFKAKGTVSPNRRLILILGVILLAYVFSIRDVNNTLLRMDELTTLGHIGALTEDSSGVPFTETVRTLAELSPEHPPVYFLMLNTWGRIFSYDVVILRMMSVFISMLSLAFMYRFAHDLGGFSVAIYACLLLATSAFFIFYTRDLRQYALQIFFIVVEWYLYWRLTRRTEPLKLWHLGLLTAVTTLLIYTHYTAAFLLVPMGIYHLLFVKKNKAWLQISGSVVLAGVLFIPWLPVVMLSAKNTVNDVIVKVGKFMMNDEVAVTMVQFFGNGEAILFAALIALGAIAAIFNRRARYVLFFFVIGTIVVFVVNDQFSFVKRIRYLLPLIISISMLGGFGLSLFNWTRIVPLIFIGIWLNQGMLFQNHYDYFFQTQIMSTLTFTEYNHLVPVVEEVMAEDELLVITVRDFGVLRDSKHGYMGIEEYYLRNFDLPTTQLYGSGSRQKFIIEDLQQETAQYDAFWMTYRAGRIKEYDKFVTSIEGIYQVCENVKYGMDSTLERYVLKSDFETLCPNGATE